jgi:hypothetical protein
MMNMGMTATGMTATSPNARQLVETIKLSAITCRANAKSFWKGTSERESNGN